MLQGSILQQLETAHRQTTRPIRFGVYYKNTLVSLCHALEDHILDSKGQPLVIAAFQQGKWYLQEADRYADIAKCCRQILIMATPDTGFAEHSTSQLENVDLLGLGPQDPVAQEWHLIIVSPVYTAMVLCQELSLEDYGVGGSPASDLERKFYGFWTFEPELVQETAGLAIAHIQEYNPELAAKLTQYQKMIQSESSTPKDLGKVVSRVVDYLETGKDCVSIPTTMEQDALLSNLVSNEVQAFLRLAQLMDMADVNNPMAAGEVVALVETMGHLLELPVWQIKRLRLAALLHRIEPLQRVHSVLDPGSSIRYQEQAPSCALTCPLVPGAQVLRTMPRLRAVAQIITHQTEWWNGTGEPAGLMGDEIPLESRILALIADFQWRVNYLSNLQSSGANQRLSKEEILAQAFEECKKEQSIHFDPKLLDTLGLLVMGLQQGLDLPMMSSKVNMGMWLIDSRWDGHGKTSEHITNYPQ